MQEGTKQEANENTCCLWWEAKPHLAHCNASCEELPAFAGTLAAKEILAQIQDWIACRGPTAESMAEELQEMSAVREKYVQEVEGENRDMLSRKQAEDVEALMECIGLVSVPSPPETPRATQALASWVAGWWSRRRWLRDGTTSWMRMSRLRWMRPERSRLRRTITMATTKQHRLQSGRPMVGRRGSAGKAAKAQALQPLVRQGQWERQRQEMIDCRSGGAFQHRHDHHSGRRYQRHFARWQGSRA